MRQLFHVVAVVGILLGAGRASAQSVTYTFEDGTDQGFGDRFTDSGASKDYPVVNIGGSNRMRVVRDGGFQEAERAVGNPADPLYQSMLAASANEAGYEISYDYYINTAEFAGGAGTYLQGGTYVNTGTGYYEQNFGTPKEFELDSVQLASGQVFSGTVTQTFAAKNFALPAGETFFRLGLILNGDGANQAVYYDNISVRPVPEPASLALLGAALPLLTTRRRGRRGRRA